MREENKIKTERILTGQTDFGKISDKGRIFLQDSGFINSQPDEDFSQRGAAISTSKAAQPKIIGTRSQLKAEWVKGQPNE